MVGKSARLIAIIAALAVASFFLADMMVRWNSMWWLVPDGFIQALKVLIEPSGQEEIANVEFAAFFTASFAILSLVVAIVWIGLRVRSHERS